MVPPGPGSTATMGVETTSVTPTINCESFIADDVLALRTESNHFMISKWVSHISGASGQRHDR